MHQILLNKYALFVVVTCCGVFSQVLYKIGSGQLRGQLSFSFSALIRLMFTAPILGGIVFQLIGMAATLLILSRAPLSWFGLMSACFPMLLAIVSVLFFGEHLTLTTIIGGVLITIGLICINL